MNRHACEILELQCNATPDSIKKRYRILAKRYHPDINKNKDAVNKFKSITLAYNALLQRPCPGFNQANQSWSYITYGKDGSITWGYYQ